MNDVRALIVDDDADFAESMALVLEGRGCDVRVALNGEEAIETVRHEDFDVAFIDVRLPGKNGVETFAEMRKLRPGARVVMMTGYSVERLLEQAVDSGAWHVLRKPLDTARLVELVEKVAARGILIADDDPDFAESVRDVLEQAGRHAVVARDGREAVERIRDDAIDALILDLRMPSLDGRGTYLELKRTGHAVPTIIVTAYAAEDADTVQALLDMSVNGVLRKPFDPRELLDEVERLSTARKE